MSEEKCAADRARPPSEVMNIHAASIELDTWAHLWPRDGRLLDLHRIAIGRRIARGELPQAAQLNAIADVVACATPRERAEMLATEIAP